MGVHPRIEIEIHSPGICIVTLRGEHDASSSEAVTLALAAARDYGGILVDLTDCDFIDSTLVAALLAASTRARQLDGALALVLPAGAGGVRRTLELAQAILPFHASRAEGVAGLMAAATTPSVRPPLRAVPAAGARPAPRRGTTTIRARVVGDSVSLADVAAAERLAVRPPADDAWGNRAA